MDRDPQLEMKFLVDFPYRLTRLTSPTAVLLVALRAAGELFSDTVSGQKNPQLEPVNTGYWPGNV